MPAALNTHTHKTVAMCVSAGADGIRMRKLALIAADTVGAVAASSAGQPKKSGTSKIRPKSDESFVDCLHRPSDRPCGKQPDITVGIL